jgi:DNA polymerase-3 subunit chi|tara:strand:+ start:34 stop:591 length:558 start_codon:yes stop_codon:yes gene_type:complete
VTRVDFYVLEDLSEDAAMRFACRLCLKAIQGGMPVHVQLEDKAQVAAMDTLLWDYPKHRFLPHQVVAGTTEAAAEQTESANATDSAEKEAESKDQTNIQTSEQARDRAKNGAGVKSPIHLGCDGPLHDGGLLINLAFQVPSFFGRFDRVAEIIVGETKDRGREHYKFYRDRGYPLHHHDLKDWEN